MCRHRQGSALAFGFPEEDEHEAANSDHAEVEEGGLLPLEPANHEVADEVREQSRASQDKPVDENAGLELVYHQVGPEKQKFD